jgi:hypothetical protein
MPSRGRVPPAGIEPRDALSNPSKEEVVRLENRWAVVALLLACLPLAGCSKGVNTAEVPEVAPAKVEHLAGGAEPTRITLIASAVKRLDIRTEAVREAKINGATRTVIPYAAVLYDTNGDTWTYTSPAPGVYVRHHIVIETVTSDQAVLTDAPALGTAVVVVGASNLYGCETEFEEE